MSVIGTTLKQPRVFSHDAIALIDLPACIYRPIDNLSIANTPDTTQGAGFIAGEIYDAVSVINPGAEGSSFQVEVTTVGATNGEILTVSLVQPTCDSEKSTNINKEDLFDVIWSPRQGQQWNEPGTASAVKLLEPGISSETPWDYGCPFTPIIRRNPNDVDLFRLQRTYKQKDIIKYTCDTCEWETHGPGASLYVGYDLSELTVIMESGKKVTWSNVPAGSFMPVSVLTVCEAIAAGPEGDRPDADALKTLILALF